MTTTTRTRRARALPLIVAAFLLSATTAAAATFTIINGDDADEGFNDTTAATPVGGNTGTTVGEQRLIAFQYAADLWGALLASDVDISVAANFDPLTCNASSGILGSATITATDALFVLNAAVGLDVSLVCPAC